MSLYAKMSYLMWLCLSSSYSFLLRDLAAQDEEEEDEGVSTEQDPSNEMTDAAEVPNDQNDKGEEEDDELAEYGLDKYDEEDAG